MDGEPPKSQGSRCIVSLSLCLVLLSILLLPPPAWPFPLAHGLAGWLSSLRLSLVQPIRTPPWLPSVTLKRWLWLLLGVPRGRCSPGLISCVSRTGSAGWAPSAMFTEEMAVNTTKIPALPTSIQANNQNHCMERSPQRCGCSLTKTNRIP